MFKNLLVYFIHHILNLVCFTYGYIYTQFFLPEYGILDISHIKAEPTCSWLNCEIVYILYEHIS